MLGQSCAILHDVFYCDTVLVKARMRIPSFQDIDFTTSDILTRVAACADTSSCKYAIANEVRSDVKNEWQSCQAIFSCITTWHFTIRKSDRRRERVRNGRWFWQVRAQANIVLRWYKHFLPLYLIAKILLLCLYLNTLNSLNSTYIYVIELRDIRTRFKIGVI